MSSKPEHKYKYWFRKYLKAKPYWRGVQYHFKSKNRYYRITDEAFQIDDGFFDKWENSVGAETKVPTNEKEFYQYSLALILESQEVYDSNEQKRIDWARKQKEYALWEQQTYGGLPR